MILETDIQQYVEEVLAGRGWRLDGLKVKDAYGKSFSIPDIPAVDVLADLPSALPSRARGDLREKTLYNIIQDLSDLTPKSRLEDSRLKAALDNAIGGDQLSRQVLPAIMKKQYWVVPVRSEGGGGSPFLTPFHAVLPGAFDYKGRYKSFRGSLLLFLSWNGQEFDLKAAHKLVTFLNSDEGMTVLDRELLRVATKLAEDSGGQLPKPDARNLEKVFGESVRGRFVVGAYDLEGLRRIREDLVTILDLPLPRHDKVAALVQGLSLNLALYYYRLAYTLGEGIAACVASAGEAPQGPRPDFSGRLRFRVGTGGDRPVRFDEPCSQSFVELDGKHLLALPANMAIANLLVLISTAAGAPVEGGLPNPYGLASAMHEQVEIRTQVDALSAVVAVLVAAEAGDPATVVERASQPGSGCLALQEAVLQNFRNRGSTLKQRGRDVVHTLVGGYVGGLKRSRGRVNFFELDEPVLFLLVELILARSGKKQIQFRAVFLPQLAEYGLRPQDREEEDKLAEALERLGMLQRYSDAGEALYVSQSL
ncbi:hypothetical protein [Kocuria rosea]|uniref:hypothetical protein n=1 Tax=Kocuria rosea TaxID=1275 RepID=UPI0025B73E4B|nr:hypothetical protein [Kocuria rosea]WJZ66668.1 hypothetical protein QR564_00830 [Kocuria rosea]